MSDQGITGEIILSKKTKILYGSGDFGLAFTDAMLGVAFMIFLIDVVGLKPAVAGLALLIGRTWDWINDPIMGYLSDSTRSRWGRRRPYILFGALPYALVFAMIWWNPPLQTQLAKAVYYGFAYTLYYTINTIISLPYFSLTPDLTPDYDERTSLTTFRMIFSLLGTGAGIMIGMSINWNPNNQSTIALLGLIFGIGASLPFLLVFFGTNENPDYQTQPKPRLFTEIKAALKNQPFLSAASIILFTFLALETIQQMLLFYLKYYLQLESATEVVSGSLIAAALLSLPFWNWLSEKLNKIKAYILGTTFLGIVLIALVFLKPGWGVGIVCFFAALAGLGFGAVQVLSWAIIPDTIEYDELQSGERHEGMFYSLVTLFRKITTALVLPATGFILGATGYVANSLEQNRGTILAIRGMMGILPAAALLVGIFFALKFPITRESFLEVQRSLERKKLQKSQATDQSVDQIGGDIK